MASGWAKVPASHIVCGVEPPGRPVPDLTFVPIITSVLVLVP